MKTLKKGKYYIHYDNSVKKHHPSYIYKKKDKENKYYIVSFTSSVGKSRTKLNKNINPNSQDNCFVLRTPRIVKRKSFSKELYGYKINDPRDKALIKYISNKKK